MPYPLGAKAQITDEVPRTPEGVEVKPGQVWLDLHMRANGRQCQVESVHDGYVALREYVNGSTGRRVTTVALKRLKKGSSGWALVEK